MFVHFAKEQGDKDEETAAADSSDQVMSGLPDIVLHSTVQQVTAAAEDITVTNL